MEFHITVKEDFHPHKLQVYETTNQENQFWSCDSQTVRDYCEKNQENIWADWGNCKKFSCVSGCAYLFCELCVKKHQIPENPNQVIKFPNHNHNLVLLTGLPIKWTCNLAFCGKKCSSDHSKEPEYRSHAVYACFQCNFFVCFADGKKFDEIEQKREKEKRPAIIEKKVTFHDHPLLLSHETDGIWSCDCLLLDMECQGNHTEAMSSHPEKKYLCTAGCAYTFCDACVFKNMQNTDPVKKFIYPSHEHELKYYSVLPYAWCCELGKIGKCIRKHEKNPDYYEDSVFVCVQCKFHICEADADAIEEERKKQDIEKTTLNKEMKLKSGEKKKEVLPTESSNSKSRSKNQNSSSNMKEEKKFDESSSSKQNKEKTEKKEKKEKKEEKEEEKSEADIEEKNEMKENLFCYEDLLEKYGNLKFVGKGSFGYVFKIKIDGAEKALKIVENMKDTNEAINEITNLIALQGIPNVLSYSKHDLVYIEVGKKRLYHIEILMDYAKMSLKEEIENIEENKIKEKYILRYMKQIANGLCGAKTKNCAHLDIKPENILIFETKSGKKELKIADWGGSIFIKSSGGVSISRENSLNIVLTKIYASPELLKYFDGKKKLEKLNFFQCDVYSLGILVLRCCGISKKRLLKIPKENQESHDQYIENLIEKIKPDYSKKVYRRVRDMCKYDVSERKTIEEIKKKLDEE